MRALPIFVAAFLGGTSFAFADWNYVPRGTWVAESPTARGIARTGVHTLLATCVDGAPFIYTSGYAAVAGGNRTETFSVVVDGVPYPVTGTHAPPDGLWTGPASQALVDALKKGRGAEVTINGEARVRYSLKGSSRALSRALTACTQRSPVPGTSAGGTTEPDDAFTHAAISRACGGAYELMEGAELSGDLDGDGKPDHVLDWAGVSCTDRSKGRGAGFCGINMCSISITLTSTGQRQQILGLNPSLKKRAFGSVALSTLALRPSCPEGVLECAINWRWTGSALEPVR